MANIYTFSFVPVAPAWSDPLDETIQHPARRLGQRTMTVVEENEDAARNQLVANYTDDEKGHTLEDVTLLDVFPVVR